MSRGSYGHCALCRREHRLTFHHLIPRALHRTKWFRKRYTREQLDSGIDVCRDCHSAIHALIPREKELGREFNTVDALLAHEEVARFVEWVATRSTARRHATRRR